MPITTAAKRFEIVVNANLAVNGKDVFEIFNGSTSCSIRISASTSLAAAWGFNYYLKYVADGSGKNNWMNGSN
ncbi:hypothetical protein I4U23_000468 [Adineta vaga]|nr:hypothetical protein I4U23_000468 [Adineta vaga]